MEITTNTESLIFLNERNVCKFMDFIDYVYYCNNTSKMCDAEFCPILKDCTDIDEFIKTVTTETINCKLQRDVEQVTDKFINEMEKKHE